MVEDDVSTQALYKEVLEGAGYEVVLAPDGADGLMKAKQGGYALILLDIMLPKFDGLAFLAALKAKPPHTKNGPIVVLTNLSSDSILNDTLNSGAAAYIVKSNVNPDQLTATVKKFIEGNT